MEANPENFQNTIESINKSANKWCKNLARVFQIEELAEAALENRDCDELEPATEPYAILALRKESGQLLKVIRWTSFYMLLLTLVYFGQAMLCLEWLDPRDFEANYWNKTYARQIYSYSLQFEKMKVVHALTLASISFFVTLFSCRYRTLTQLHYMQLLAVSLLVSVLYFLPLIWVAYAAYDPYEEEFEEGSTPAFYDSDKPEWEKATIRFADWFYMLLERSDLGKWGLTISVLIHVQIYLLLLVMQWCAWHIRTIGVKIKMMKEASQGTYMGVEMHSASDENRH